MPYKSDAQRRFFHAALARGEMKKKTVDEFDQASAGMALPEKTDDNKKKAKMKALAGLAGRRF